MIIRIGFLVIYFCSSLAFGQLPSDFRTPQGYAVKFKQVNNQFYLQWETNDSLRTVDYPFPVGCADARLPKLKSENKNYLVMRAGCGNPCWVGFFLPLNRNARPAIIHEYIAFDLNNHLVASINIDSIEITNLITLKKQCFKPGNCESAFIGYCVDKAYFKNNILYYNWTPQTRMNKSKIIMQKYAVKNSWR